MKKQLIKIAILAAVFAVVAGTSFLKVTSDRKYDGLLNQAGHQHDMGKHNLAESTAKRAVEMRENAPEGHALLGDIYLTMKKPVPARYHFKKAISLDPSDASNYWSLSFVHFNLLHEKKKALELATTAVKMDPSNYQYHITRGVYLEKSGRVDEAIDQFEEALKLAPSLKGLKAKITALRQNQLKVTGKSAEER